MELKNATVRHALNEFIEVYGAPSHCKTQDHAERIANIYHRELSKQFTEETFRQGLDIAWNQARKFPVIADFHRGFDAPEKYEPNFKGYNK